MVLVIDTGGVEAAVAVLHPDLSPQAQTAGQSRGFALDEAVRKLVEPGRLTRVGVAVGPGSFTGLRIGAAYAAGLAMGLGVPLHALSSLALARARAPIPALGVVEAGRGRLHFQPEGGPVATGFPADLPAGLPLAGAVREETAEAIRAAGLHLLGPHEMLTFAQAAGRVMEVSAEVAYGRLRLEYMESLGGLA